MKGWPKVTLPDCCEIVSGSTPSRLKPNYWGGDIPWVTPKDLKGGDEKYIQDTPEKITKQGYDSCSTRMLPSGSILFTSRAPIGLVAIAGKPMCTNQGFKSLVPGPEVSSDYLYWCMRWMSPRVVAMGRGTTFTEVSRSVMERVRIPLPPLVDQARIASILDKAEEIRRKREQSIQLCDQLLKSVFLEMFGDPVTNPKGWEKRPLGEYLHDIESGWSPRCLARSAAGGEWGILKLGSVTWGRFDPHESKALAPGATPRRDIEVRAGDLLITRKNTYELVGASAFVFNTPTRLMLPDLIFRLRLSQGLDPIFTWQLLSTSTMRDELRRLASGTSGSMPNISKTRLRRLVVIAPEAMLQSRFASLALGVHDLRSLITEMSSESDCLRRALTSMLLCG